MGLPLEKYDPTCSDFSMLSYNVVQDKESKAEGDTSVSTVTPMKMCSVSVQYEDKLRIFRPEVISGLLLATIKDELVSMYNLHSDAPKVVISVPAYFNTVQRRATEAAGRMAGLKVLRVVNEPTAGAYAYALHHKVNKDRKVLVYDFGGGTFDCTTLERQNFKGITRMKVMATKGNAALGGEDIDEEIQVISSGKDW